MSDTLRTDAVVNKSVEEDDGAYMAEDLLFHARELERENEELRKYNERLKIARECDIERSRLLQDSRRLDKVLNDNLKFVRLYGRSYVPLLTSRADIDEAMGGNV